MIKKVQIPQELILEVQRLWFEYQSNLNILGYLMTQNDINKELLAEYNQDTKTRFTECEMYKQKIADYFLQIYIFLSKKTKKIAWANVHDILIFSYAT